MEGLDIVSKLAKTTQDVRVREVPTLPFLRNESLEVKNSNCFGALLSV